MVQKSVRPGRLVLIYYRFWKMRRIRAPLNPTTELVWSYDDTPLERATATFRPFVRSFGGKHERTKREEERSNGDAAIEGEMRGTGEELRARFDQRFEIRDLRFEFTNLGNVY